MNGYFGLYSSRLRNPVKILWARQDLRPAKPTEALRHELLLLQILLIELAIQRTVVGSIAVGGFAGCQQNRGACEEHEVMCFHKGEFGREVRLTA